MIFFSINRTRVHAQNKRVQSRRKCGPYTKLSPLLFIAMFITAFQYQLLLSAQRIVTWVQVRIRFGKSSRNDGRIVLQASPLNEIARIVACAVPTRPDLMPGLSGVERGGSLWVMYGTTDG